MISRQPSQSHQLTDHELAVAWPGLLCWYDHPATHPRGVQVIGARITDKLDLDGVDCKVGLSLLGCWFDEPMTAWGANLPGLWLYDSHLPSLVAGRLQTLGSVDLDRVRVSGHPEDGAVLLRGVNIGGHLLCHGAQLHNDTGPALHAEAMQVTGSVVLRRGFTAVGHGKDAAVRLRFARIGTNLEFGRGVANPDRPVLDLRSAAVTQLILSRQAFNCPVQAEEDASRQDTDMPLLLDGLTYSMIPADPRRAE
jgi:hypothetical protein